MSANYQTLPPPPPAGSGAAPQPRGGGGTKILIGCLVGGAIVFALLVGGGLVIGGIMFARNVSVGTKVPVPPDFPVYPHARQSTAFSVAAKDHDPAHAVSLVQWVARGGAAPVREFYATDLNAGDWEILDQNSVRIVFRRKSTGHIAQLMIRDQLLQTIIQLQMTGDQPMDPGAQEETPPPGGSTTN